MHVNTLRLLHAMERSAPTPEQRGALQDALLVLSFILARHEEADFERFLKNPTRRPKASSLSFQTKQDADAWLQSHPAPPHGAYVAVGQALYHVAYVRELGHRKLLPLPTEEEWARMEAGPEEAAKEGMESPPPRPGPAFDLFGLYKYVCFHLHEVEQQVSSPEELEALRVARFAFDFVMGEGESHGLEEYLDTLRSSGTSSPVRSFSTREEAESWLNTQPEPPPPAVVSIGRELYSVGYHRTRGQRLLLRLPTSLGWDAAAP